MEILEELHEVHKVTVIVVTHDESIGKMADRRILIRDGKIVNSKGDGKLICQI
jgi:ABC-type lipoprotein export system ATPase subunit